ncbi:two-component regulator propeller domain-containing protein [Terrimonas rubra]|uniref:Oxygen sensor histidine kinase NreB n=1 Tax=Terrimonas rubra TaxID=1035890 RepID=A0ABW6A1S0_9BACT
MRTSIYNGTVSLLLLCMFTLAGKLYAQQYNFFNLSVNEGLIQSQAGGITQDKQGHLWISTQGGVSRYDGKRFVHFTTKEGLPSNIVISLACDNKGNMWFGTDKGLSFYNGKKFVTATLNLEARDNIVGQLVADSTGSLYALARGKLFKLNNHKAERVLPAADSSIVITAIGVHPSGILWCGTLNKGIFILDKKGWTNITFTGTDKNNLRVRRLLVNHAGAVILTNKGIYRSNGQSIIPDTLLQSQGWDETTITALANDKQGNLWLGSASGTYLVKPDRTLIYFQKKNGFTDARTQFIFCDRENNTWIASDGQGIFRYSGDRFTFYNEASGLPDPVAMSLVKDGQRIWIATYGGVVSLEKGRITPYPQIPANGLQVMSAAMDGNGRYWIGTYRGGALYYNGKQFIPCYNNEALVNKAAIGELFTDVHKRLWVAASTGFGYIENYRYQPVKTTGITWGFAPAGDEVLVATGEGLFLINKTDSIYPASKLPLFKEKQVTGMMQDKDKNYWLQTNGDGILIWNKEKDTILTTITKEDGLPSNVVYSLFRDSKDRYWVGTGYGLAAITITKDHHIRSVERFGKSQGMFGMEANKNAFLETADSAIYYGTTSGVFVYRENSTVPPAGVQEVLLQSVNLFGKPLRDTGSVNSNDQWYTIPASLNLTHDQHNLSFDFIAINFGAADDISYQYYLQGSDTGWSAPSMYNSVSFSSLSPGKYTLLLRARAGNGEWCTPLHYTFTIHPPFYESAWFRVLAIVSLVLLGISIQYFRMQWKRKRAADLEKVKQEEQQRMRMKTAEDFHDEVGNKLTRIGLLAGVLEKKLDNKEEETMALAIAIKENAAALYTDARDIIWSLKPDSDNLLEVLERIEYLCHDLFQYTGIKFSMDGLLPEMNTVELPPDYNRNLIMIVKEAMNNIIKHASAKEVHIKAIYDKPMLTLLMQDDGKGLDDNVPGRGSGLVNMKNRAERLNGSFTVDSKINQGTQLTVRIPLINKY